MSFTIAELVTYAQALVCSGADGTNVTNIATTLAEDELPANDYGGNQTLVAAVAGTAEYTVSVTVRKVYAIFYGGRQLSYERQSDLAATSPTWEDTRGTPIAWTDQLQKDRTFRAFPTPDLPSASTNSLVTETDRFILLGTLAMSTMPDHLRLPAALWVLAREYERESNHRDMVLAKIARTLAERYFTMLEGV